MKWTSGFGVILSSLILAAPRSSAGRSFPPETDDRRFHPGLLSTIEYRNIGPFRAGAWISDLAVPETPPRAHRYTFYVATRSGGLWKTTNNGTTFQPLFDDQSVSSIGAVTVAPSDARTVWVGTGGADNARSTYYGDGIYKSTDAGATWRNMGLEDSQHIARIVVHPTNPDIVYVAAMGHLFSANEVRGVFKTTDGGESWDKVLYVNESVGAIDLVVNRDEPDVVYAAMYEKYRYPWHFEEGGPESGIYKTTDGGRDWTRLGGGLPTGKIGRIGLDIYRRDPNIVYAIVENANLRPPSEEEAEADRLRGRQPQERTLGGEVYRSDDAAATWTKMNSPEDNVGGKAAYSFNQIRVDPNDDKKVIVNTVALANSTDGGKTWHDVDWPPKRMFPNFFGDVRTMWIDPEDSDRIILGTDGGVHLSYDGGKTSDFYDNLPLGEFYAIDVDMEDPYHIYGGLQDHESWKGPVNSWSGEVSLEDWVTVGSGDGMYNQVDPTDSRWLYNSSQHGTIHRVDQQRATRRLITPHSNPGEPAYRFTWNTPIHISPHNPAIVYTGGQMLLRSLNRGDDWEEVSPDLSTNDPVKIAGRGNIQYCTITTISESPVKSGVIWLGTDDGRVHVTRDHGAHWTDLTLRIADAGGPENFWVSRVHASGSDAATAYAAKSGYRRDDFRPFLFKTTNHGESWTAITHDLPERPINVVFEDRKNPSLLFLGNDVGVYVSIDGGDDWVPMKGNMPTVPVHDLLVHPRENDLVVGTFGRGVWITDVGPLQEMTESMLEEDVYLFEIESKSARKRQAWGNYQLYGDRHIVTSNEPLGLVINYYLKKASPAKVELSIADPYGGPVNRLEGDGDAGLNRVIWEMNDENDEPVPPGEYVVTLRIDDARWMRRVRITE